MTKFFKLLAAVGGFAPFVIACKDFETPPEWPFDVTTLKAPDGSITAKFVSLGATLKELWVKDRDGKARDVVLGYDDPSELLTDPDHPVFNAIVGRYAGPLKNGTFSIPISRDPAPNGRNTYHIPKADGEEYTLHGGIVGWDRRNWTVVSKSPTSVTYFHLDTADEGFPGFVAAHVTHTVENGGILRTSILAKPTEETPIMLTQHNYWNLDGFDGSDDILAHKLRLDASRVVDIDSNQIPTGKFIDVEGTPFDFREAREIGADWNKTENLCGEECQGYDHNWIFDNDESEKPGVSLWSENSGIRLDVTTNNPAVQVYTAFWLETPRKQAHGGPDKTYTSWAGVAIEQQGYADAINTPDFGVDQIYRPGKDYIWYSTYKFSTVE